MTEVSQAEAESKRDHALILAWSSGDDSALETLLRNYQSRIFSFLCRMLRHAHDAEDAAQETFIRAARHLQRFDPGKGAFKSWLFQIAYREGLRLAEKRKRLPVGEGAWTALDAPPPEAVDPAPLPGRQLLDRESTAALAAALDRLPDAERQVVLLRTASGLRFREISEMMGTPLNTTLGRMHNATRRLKEWMDGTQANP
jgi:RNA polymerase sigma-70 factor (ECF subfamily)